MSGRAATRTSATPVSAATPVRSRLIQRACQCGAAPGLDDKCDECRGKQMAGKRSAPRVQAQLVVGPTNDRYEQEADRVAAQVMRTSGAADGATAAVQPEVRRATPDGQASGVPVTDPVTAARIERMPGGGRPLPAAARDFFEPRFGRDFGNVRVHTDADTSGAARSIGARAFTVGSDIGFAQGAYDPDSQAGRHLLAHELTHVAQQVPHVARDPHPVTPKALPECIKGHPEGSAQIAEIHPDFVNELGTHAAKVWGTWLPNDNVTSYLERIFTKWIGWRFGHVSADVREQMIVRLLRTQRLIHDRNPPAGCQYYTAVPLILVGQLEVVAKRDQKQQKKKAGEEATQREKAAGLPSPEERPVAGLKPDSGSKEPPPDQKQPPADHKPVPHTENEFKGGSGPQVTAPALRAKITGPDFGVTRAIGTYQMKLEYADAGADALSQVVEAMNWVNYHWEVFDITALVREGLTKEKKDKLKQQPAGSENEVGKMAAAGRRAEHAVENLTDDVKSAAGGLADPIEAAHGNGPAAVVTRAIANYESLVLLPASALVEAGGFAIGALADLLGGTFQEREIPWPNTEGYFMVRCIAAPNPQGANGEFRRAASVDTKIVQVQKPGKRAKDSLDEPAAEIAEAQLELALEQDPAKQKELEGRIEDMKVAAEGDPIDVLDRAIARLTTKRNAASGRSRDALDDELEKLVNRRELAEKQREGMALGGKVYRPKVSLASKETGETYPLLLQLMELPQEGSSYKFRVADLTSQDGKSWTGGGTTRDAAVWNAFKEMATHNAFGRGQIAIRLPADAPFAKKEDVLENTPADTELVKKRLNDLVSVLVVLGLFVPGVGAVAAVVGAGLAAERLISRWQNGTLRFDAAAVTDFIAVLGAVGQGAVAIGRMRVVKAGERFFLAAEKADDVGLMAAAEALKTAKKVEDVIAIGNHVVNAGGMAWGTYTVIDDLAKISQQEMAGTISHAEARRQRAHRATSAIKDYALQLASMKATKAGHSSGKLPPHEGQAKPHADAPAESSPAGKGEPHAGKPTQPAEGKGTASEAKPAQKPAHAGESGEAPGTAKKPAPGDEGRPAKDTPAKPDAEQSPAEAMAREKPPNEPTESTKADPAAAAELKKLGPVDEHTRTKLEADDNLRKALAENELAASALKKCNTPCFPDEATPEHVAKLERILRRLNDTGGIDSELLKQFLHDNRNRLGEAIQSLDAWRTSGQLNAILRFFAEGGTVTKLPASLDPKLFTAMIERAHDIGVAGGRKMAADEGLSPTGWKNPFEGDGKFGQGFDDIMVKGGDLDTGQVYIVEYKGGRAKLADGQMSLDWVRGNIRRLNAEGGAKGQELARQLVKAMKEGRLHGVVYSTPIANGTPGQTVKVTPPHETFPSMGMKLLPPKF